MITKQQKLGLQHQIAMSFLKAIFENDDALSFWRLISNEAKGFFKGLWYSKGLFTLEQMREIHPDDFFIKDQLNIVLATIRHTWNIDVNEYDGISGKINYDDQFHARVKFVSNIDKESIVTAKAVFVPLVYELTVTPGQRNPTWKVDFLRLAKL